MKLNLEQIKSITLGAAYVEQGEKGIGFHRFTKEQEEVYLAIKGDGFLRKCLSTSGIRLSFETDSTTLGISVDVARASGRRYFAFDLFVNGEYRESLENYSGVAVENIYPRTEYPLGYFEKTFALGEGSKTVMLYFPWSALVDLHTLTLDDGASFTPVRRPKKLLAYGDSITHGYDALKPSNRYIGRLADALNAEEYNKANGGEIFFPELAALDEPFVPDIITVAYGANDWGKNPDRATMVSHASDFYRILAEKYPNVPIFACTPIWGTFYGNVTNVGTFEDAMQIIADAVSPYPNIRLIECKHAIPWDPNLYGDLRYHPSDEGFDYQFKFVYGKIRQYL